MRVCVLARVEGELKGLPAKLLCVARFALLDDMDEVMGEDEGDTLPLDPKLGLEVPEDVAKVYMEELRDGGPISENQG